MVSGKNCKFKPQPQNIDLLCFTLSITMIMGSDKTANLSFSIYK